MFDIRKPSRLGVTMSLVLVFIYANIDFIFSRGWLLALVAGVVGASVFWWYLATSEIRRLRGKLDEAEATVDFSASVAFYVCWLMRKFDGLTYNNIDGEKLKKALTGYNQHAKRLESILANYKIGEEILDGLSQEDSEIAREFSKFIKAYKPTESN